MSYGKKKYLEKTKNIAPNQELTVESIEVTKLNAIIIGLTQSLITIRHNYETDV